jgi:signal transduction histidine kinase
MIGPARRAPSIRTLLLGAHAFALLLPLGALALLRVYDVYLLRQTEHQLIAESVVTGELFRGAYLEARGLAPGDHHPPASVRTYGDETYAPFAAQIGFDTPVEPREPPRSPRSHTPDPEALAAGRAIGGALARAQTFNLSGMRVLDAQGCVVGSSRAQEGECLGELPEVKAALAGRYASVLRARVSDEPAPAFGELRRRGKVRVFTALPVYADGRVIAVVRASRTGLDAASSLWANRRGLVWLAAITALFVLTLSFAASAAIARPLRRLARAAQRVRATGDASPLAIRGPAPREVAELRDVLAAMASELSARARYVQSFASEVSHELKTPITAIRGAAELLAHDDMAPEDRARFLANILDDAGRMERLVTRLLELARLEAGTREPEAALDALGRVRALCSRFGARVDVQAPYTLAPLAIAPEQLDSVVLNLVDNALRHGAGQPVRVRLESAGSRLALSVHDRGKGVSEANRKRLFERFFTTERDRGGTGLGLAIVKAIAEARGGEVRAEFGAEGTVFRVTL